MFVVRMSRFCIAISICDCLLHTRWFWYFLLPGVWPWTLEWILMYFQETQGLLPGRFNILSNGKQNSGSEHSVQQSCFPCTYVSLLPKNGCGVMLVTRGNHEFRSEHPHQGNRSAFRRSVAPEDFHLKGTSGVTRSLSRLYTGREQYETAFKLAFYF